MPVRFEAQTVDVARIIGLALTPVFLVSSLGVLLNVLTNRVARLSDRARKLAEQDAPRTLEDLGALVGIADRTRILYVAIAANLLAGVLATVIVLLLFANTYFESDLSVWVERCFMLTSLATLAALVLFFVEVVYAAVLLNRRRQRLKAALDAETAMRAARSP